MLESIFVWDNFMMRIDYYVGQLTHHILLAIYLSQSTINHNAWQKNDVLGEKNWITNR